MQGNAELGGGHAGRAVRATFWSAVNTLIPILSGLGVFVATARILTPGQFGVVAFATGLALIGSALCPGGFGEAIIQKTEISLRQLDSIFWLCIASGIVVWILECAVALPVARLFKMDSLAVFIPTISSRIMADMAAVVPNALLARAMSFNVIALRTFVVSIFAAAVTVGLLLAGFGIWALIISQIASSYVVMAVGFTAAKWRPRMGFSLEAVKELTGYGLFSSGTQNLTKLFQQNEQILVGLFLGTTQLGFYNFSKQVLSVLNNIIAGSLGAVAHPMFSGIQNDKARVKTGFLSATFFSSLISFPMFVGSALVADRIIPIAFGERWASVVPLVQLQCAIGLLSCVGLLQAGLITSQGKASWWFYYQLLATVSTALIIIALARFGLEVMLIGMAAKTYVIWCIPVRNSCVLLDMRVSQYLLNFKTPIIGSLVMALAIELENLFLTGISPIGTVTANILTGGVAYAAVCLVLDASRICGFLVILLPKAKILHKYC